MKLFVFFFVACFSVSVWSSEDSFQAYLSDLDRLQHAQKEDKELITYQGKHSELLKSVFSEDRVNALYRDFGIDLQFGADVMKIYGDVISDYERAFYIGDGQFDEVYLDGLGVLFSVTYAHAVHALRERPEDEPDLAKRAMQKSFTRLSVTLAKTSPRQVRMQIDDGLYREDFMPVAKERFNIWKKKLDMAGIEL